MDFYIYLYKFFFALIPLTIGDCMSRMRKRNYNYQNEFCCKCKNFVLKGEGCWEHSNNYQPSRVYCLPCWYDKYGQIKLPLEY